MIFGTDAAPAPATSVSTVTVSADAAKGKSAAGKAAADLKAKTKKAKSESLPAEEKQGTIIIWLSLLPFCLSNLLQNNFAKSFLTFSTYSLVGLLIINVHLK